MANAEQVIKPTRIKKLGDLAAALDRWEVMIVQCGLEIPEWAKNSGLLELVPEDIKFKIDQNPSLETYDQKLRFVRVLVRDFKGTSEEGHTTGKNQQAMDIGPLEQ